MVLIRDIFFYIRSSENNLDLCFMEMISSLPASIGKIIYYNSLIFIYKEIIILTGGTGQTQSQLLIGKKHKMVSN